MVYQKIIRHGNSLAVVIPVEVCRSVGFRLADDVILAPLFGGSGIKIIKTSASVPQSDDEHSLDGERVVKLA
jgi:antitoxin component of MazEF toxin-antitoxin module